MAAARGASPAEVEAAARAAEDDESDGVSRGTKVANETTMSTIASASANSDRRSGHVRDSTSIGDAVIGPTIEMDISLCPMNVVDKIEKLEESVEERERQSSFATKGVKKAAPPMVLERGSEVGKPGGSLHGDEVRGNGKLGRRQLIEEVSEKTKR